MKLKKSSLEQVEAEVANQQSGGAFLSARFRNPAEVAPVAVSSTAEKIGMICAVLTTIILIAISTMLYMNWDLIKTV